MIQLIFLCGRLSVAHCLRRASCHRPLRKAPSTFRLERISNQAKLEKVTEFFKNEVATGRSPARNS